MAQNDTTLVFGAVDKVTPVLRGIQTEVGKMSGAFSSLANVAGGLIGVLGTRAIVNFGRSLIDAGDQVNTVAKRLNIAASSFSAMGYAVKQAGSDVSTLQTGLTFLSRQLANAAAGGKATELFDALGISIRNAKGELKGADVVLKELATRFEQTRDGPEELALAVKALGRSAGPELVQFLNLGQRGIEEFEQTARDLGIVLSDDFARQADEFNDKLATLGEIGRGIGRDFVQELLPAMDRLGQALIDNRKEFGEATPIARGFADVVKLVTTVAIGAASAIEGLVIQFAYLKEKSKDVDAVNEGILRFNKGMGAFVTGNFRGALQQLGDGFRAMAEDSTAAGDALRTSLGDAATRTKRQLDALNGTVAEQDKNWGLFIGSGKAKQAAVVIGNTGTASKKAAVEVKDLGIAVEKLVDPSAEIIDLLSRTAAEMGGPVVAAALEYRDQLVKIAELQAALLAQGPPTAEAAGQFEALTRAARKAGEDYQAVQAGNIAANEDFVENFQGMSREVYSNWDNLTDSMSAAFGDFIAGNLDSWEEFGDAMKRIAQDFLSDLVSEFASTQLRVNMSASGGGGGGGLGGFGGAGLASLLGPAGLLYAGAQTGNPGQGALYGAGAGLLFASGSIGAGLIGGTALAAGSAAATGAALGSVVPIIGTIIGALIGAAAAYFMQEDPPAIDVIGSGLVGGPGYRNLSPGSTYGSGLGGFTFASIDTVDREARDTIAGFIQEFDDTIASFLTQDELGRVTQELADFQLHLEEGAISVENILGQRWAEILSVFPEDVREVVEAAGTLEEQVKKLGEVLRFPDAIRAILDQFANADEEAGLSELERQLLAVNEQFDQAREALELMSASEEQLAQIEVFRAAALDRVTEATARANAAALASLTDDIVFEDSIAALSDYEKEIERVNRYYADLTARAVELGASQETLDAIERTRVRRINELTAAQEDNIAATATLADIYDAMNDESDLARSQLDSLREAAAGIRDFLDAMAFGATSSLSPAQRFNAAQEQFRDLARRAAGGDLGAIGDLTGAAQNLLTEGRSFFGATDQFSALERFVRDALTPFGQLDQANSLPDAINQLREVLELLNRTLTGNIATGGAGASNVVYLNAVRDNTTAVNAMKTAVVAELRRLGGNTSRVG